MARNENLPVKRQSNGDTWLLPARGADLWRPDAFFNASPWQLMRRMQDEMDRMFGETFSGFGSLAPRYGDQSGGGTPTWNPSIDISEDQKEYRIEVDLPGVNKDGIQVEVNRGQLTIRAEMRQESDTGKPEQQTSQPQQQQGSQPQRQYLRRERRFGYFERSFPLPDDVNQDQIQCDFRDGVLTCHLAKSENAQTHARRIPVGEGGQQQITGQAQQPAQEKRKAA